MRMRPIVVALYALLLASAAATFLGLPVLDQAVREGRARPAVLIVPPAFLAVFIASFAVYRFALARAGHYNPGKAFVQIGLMVLVLTLLVPGSFDRYRAAGVARPVDLGRQLGSSDPESRAMAAELLRHRDRSDALRHVARLIALLDDPSPEVRRQARASLVSLAGRDAAGDGPEAGRRWFEFWRAEGAIPASR